MNRALLILLTLFSLSIEAKWVGGPRDYERPVTVEEKRDVAFIINTLGNASLFDLPRLRPQLDEAGVRVEHLHPLKFLTTIFSDEEIKRSMVLMSQRLLVYNRFMRNLKDNLNHEAKNENITIVQVRDFTKKVGVPITAVKPHFQKRDWIEFVEVLIKRPN